MIIIEFISPQTKMEPFAKIDIKGGMTIGKGTIIESESAMRVGSERGIKDLGKIFFVLDVVTLIPDKGKISQIVKAVDIQEYKTLINQGSQPPAIRKVGDHEIRKFTGR